MTGFTFESSRVGTDYVIKYEGAEYVIYHSQLGFYLDSFATLADAETAVELYVQGHLPREAREVITQKVTPCSSSCTPRYSS